MHDTASINPIMLRWRKAPFCSSNFKLELSHLNFFLLAESCFIIPEDWKCQPFPSEEPNSLGLCRHDDNNYLLSYTPLTYHHVLQSIEERFPGATKSVLVKAVPPPHQLASRTQHSWLNGEPVLLFTIKSSSFESFQKCLEKNSTELLLMTNEELDEHKAKPDDPIKAHCVDFLCLTDSRVGNMEHIDGIRISGFEEDDEKSFSFFLASDHGLDLKTQFCVHNAEDDTMTTFGLFTQFTNKVITNPKPLFGKKHPLPEIGAESSGLHIVKYREFEESYELEVCVQGYPITAMKGTFLPPFYNWLINIKFVFFPSFSTFLELSVIGEKQHPSASAHKLTLKLADETPVVIQLPWPFLTKDIEIPTPEEKENKLFFNVSLWKSVNDPWPEDYSQRSKWVVDELVPWKELVTNGDFKKHLEAQFSCQYLYDEKHSTTEQSSEMELETVREAVRSIFYGYCDESYHIFAVHCQDNPEKSIFHFRVHQPMRFSPDGSPMLMVSAVDHELEEELKTGGKLDEEQSRADFHRIITEGVSRNICKITLPSTVENNLLRYSLRLNSTKIRPTGWQSKNLPRGETSPWMATFVSPLYSEEPFEMCEMLEKKHNNDPTYLLSQALAETFSNFLNEYSEDEDDDSDSVYEYSESDSDLDC